MWWVWLGSDLLLLSLLLSLSGQLLALVYRSFARGKGCPLYKWRALFPKDGGERGGEWHGSSVSSKSTSCSSPHSEGTNLKHVAPAINSLHYLGFVNVAPASRNNLKNNSGCIEGGEVEAWGRDGHCAAGTQFLLSSGRAGREPPAASVSLGFSLLSEDGSKVTDVSGRNHDFTFLRSYIIFLGERIAKPNQRFIVWLTFEYLKKCCFGVSNYCSKVENLRNCLYPDINCLQLLLDSA